MWRYCAFYCAGFTDDCYWVCSGLGIIRRTDTWSVIDCRIHGGLVLDL